MLERNTVLLDVDGCLVSQAIAKEALKYAMEQGLLPVSNRVRGVAISALKKHFSRRTLVEQLQGVWGRALLRNPEGMYLAYQVIAESEELRIPGAAEWLKCLGDVGVHRVLISGSHTQFVQSHLRAMGMDDPEVSSIQVLGSEYEGGRLQVSRALGPEKAAAVSVHRASWGRVIGAAGNSESDIPLFEEVVPGGFRLAVENLGGENSDFFSVLEDQGYECYRDMSAFLDSTNERRVLVIGEGGDRTRAASYLQLDKNFIQKILVQIS